MHPPSVAEPTPVPSVEQLLDWLAGAVQARDAHAAEGCIAELFRDNPHRVVHLPEDERARAARVHEAIDAGLRRVILADEVPGRAWETLLLPEGGERFERTQWLANAMWLRLAGSALVERGDEPVAPDAFAGLPFVHQAKALGRMCVTTDAGRAVDYAGLLEVLDRRLWPALTSWLLCVYLQSPDGVVPPAVVERQRRAAEALVAVWADRPGEPPVAPRAFGACFRQGYVTGGSLRPLDALVQGRFLRALFDRERGRARRDAPAAPVPGSNGLERLEPGGTLVVSSVWREHHVVHRCMGPLLESRRRAGAVALVLEHLPEDRRPPLPERWAGQVVNPATAPDVPPLTQLARLADELVGARQELVVFPEVGLTNDSLWLATQRIARVQVSGYGHPVTSGSPELDYFVGGTEVEGPDADYAEQLVLIPGLGVSTTVPPASRRVRTRPIDDDRLRVVSLASRQKLHPALLAAWEAILGRRAGAELELLPSVTPEQARRMVPGLAAHLPTTRVRLRPRVPREAVADLLVDADLYLDSYPFGGFNTLVEVLAAGCPVVTLEGSQARNRFGAAVLRRLDCPEWLIARDWSGYVSAARRLLGDAGLRAELRARIGGRDRVLAALADPAAERHFEAALEWMRARGPRAGRRPGPPVRIEAG